MDELERIRQRRLAELQAQSAEAAGHQSAHQAHQAQAQADQMAAEQEAAIEQMLSQVLEPEARERITNIKLSRPDFYSNVVRQLASMAQSGRLHRRLTDADLRQVLVQLTPKDRDIRITRR